MRPVVFLVREYLTADVFRDWLKTLDRAVRARIQARVLRFELGNLGNLGDHKHVGAGVWEARLAFGPGYRIYLGKDGATVVVLLAGGSKASQAADIPRAQEFWRDYQEVKKHGSAQ